MGAVANVVNSVASVFDKVIAAPAKPVIDKFVPEPLKPITSFRHGAETLTNPVKAAKTSFGAGVGLYDEVSGKREQREAAAAAAAQAKAANDAHLAEVEKQAKTKQFNESALAAAMAAQTAARAQRVRSVRGGGRSTLLTGPQGIQSPGGTSIGGIRGYSTLLGGG